MFDELSRQARLTSEWAHHRSTPFALRSLCCIDLPAMQEDVAERAMNGRPGRCESSSSLTNQPEVLGLALAEDGQRLLLDGASRL